MREQSALAFQFPPCLKLIPKKLLFSNISNRKTKEAEVAKNKKRQGGWAFRTHPPCLFPLVEVEPFLQLRLAALKPKKLFDMLLERIDSFLITVLQKHHPRRAFYARLV